MEIHSGENMDTSVLAALIAAGITSGASILAALITRDTAISVERIKQEKAKKKAQSGSSPHQWIELKRRWVRSIGYPVAVLVALAGGFSVFQLTYDGTAARLERSLPDIPGFKKRIYANIGLGFIYPEGWEIEDYAWRFGGGQLEIVADRNSDGKIETQGLTVEINNIAKHHWPDPQSEFEHFEQQLKERCVASKKASESLSGGQHVAALFTCHREKGSWSQDEWTYLYQLQPSRCVRLKIVAWSDINPSAPARARFDQERRQFLQYLQLDRIKIQSLIDGVQTGCDATPA
ncbi:MAG: hypothetical protein ACJ8J7_02045 [Sulfurifustaceae bacterium]